LATFAIALALASASCVTAGSPRSALPDPPPRARAYVDTFDRVLIAGFVADHVRDRGRAVDVNEETARVLRMTLRQKGDLNVIEAEPIELKRAASAGEAIEDPLFSDVHYWRRLGEEYRDPLIVTGVVTFEPSGSQLDERTVGRRTVRVWRPTFRLTMQLLFISGRTGERLDAVRFGPVPGRAPHAPTSALGLFFGLVDRLTPKVLTSLGRQGTTGLP
jgi:hypothetical protein